MTNLGLRAANAEIPLRSAHSFTLGADQDVPVVSTVLGGIYVPVATGQTVKLVAARAKLASGTRSDVKLQRNGADATGWGTTGTPLTVETTAETFDPADITLADLDLLELLALGGTGSPKGIVFTIILEHLI